MNEAPGPAKIAGVVNGQVRMDQGLGHELYDLNQGTFYQAGPNGMPLDSVGFLSMTSFGPDPPPRLLWTTPGVAWAVEAFHARAEFGSS